MNGPVFLVAANDVAGWPRKINEQKSRGAINSSDGSAEEERATIAVGCRRDGGLLVLGGRLMTVGSLCGVVSLAIQSLHDGSRWVLALRGALAGEPHHVQNIPEPNTDATQQTLDGDGDGETRMKCVNGFLRGMSGKVFARNGPTARTSKPTWKNGTVNCVSPCKSMDRTP